MKCTNNSILILIKKNVHLNISPTGQDSTTPERETGTSKEDNSE